MRVRRVPCKALLGIQGAADAQAGFLHHMGVDLGRFNAFVPEQILDRPDVHASFQQMRRKGVPQDVRRHAFRQLRAHASCTNVVLKRAVDHVMPASHSGRRVYARFPRWKQPLPLEALARFRVLPREPFRQPYTVQAGRPIRGIEIASPRRFWPGLKANGDGWNVARA